MDFDDDVKVLNQRRNFIIEVINRLEDFPSWQTNHCGLRGITIQTGAQLGLVDWRVEVLVEPRVANLFCWKAKPT